MDEKTKELLLFTINEKAVVAFTRASKEGAGGDIKKQYYWTGQYSAYNSLYSLVKNM